MTKCKQFHNYLLLVAIAACLVTCDSSTPVPKPPSSVQCRVKSITITNSVYNVVLTYQYSYNDEGLVSEIVYNNGSSENKSFITYRTGKPYLVKKFASTSNEWIQQLEVTLYSNGILKDITSLYNYPGATPSSLSFTKYSMTSTAIVNNKTEIHASIFTWYINNDLMRFADEDDNDDPAKGTYYTYYTDKVYEPKNVNDFTRSLSTYQGFEFISTYGAPAYATPHLVKEQKNGYSTSTYEYEFDGDGKITKITITSDIGVKSFFVPVYDCP